MPDPDPRLLMAKNWKNIAAEKKIYIVLLKNFN
jgi:hypothetical protein